MLCWTCRGGHTSGAPRLLPWWHRQALPTALALARQAWPCPPPLRPCRSCDLVLPTERIGAYETQLVEHFFQSLANTSGMTLHIRQARRGGGAARGSAAAPARGTLCLLTCTKDSISTCQAPCPPQTRPTPSVLYVQLAGRNSHHIVEATFKAFARALRHACEADPRRAGTIASSKGVLTQQ